MNIERIASDLSPGDSRCAPFDFAELTIDRIERSDDPLFERAYEFLWNEFGARHEVEQKHVLVARLKRDPGKIIGGFSFLYEMIVVRSGEELAAVRDHTAIVPRDGSEIVVHLSHLLIATSWRGAGLAGWMRAFPIQTARRAAKIAGIRRRKKLDITLVAEMEHPDSNQIDTLIRLKSYQRAGFLKVDPFAIAYHQPDFRHFAEIDATGVRPLPMALIVRQVGRENQSSLGGEALRHLVRALYAMYGLELRPKDMAALVAETERQPPEIVRLLPPTAT